MKWKLWTRNENIMACDDRVRNNTTRRTLLWRGACDIIRPPTARSRSSTLKDRTASGSKLRIYRGVV